MPSTCTRGPLGATKASLMMSLLLTGYREVSYKLGSGPNPAFTDTGLRPSQMGRPS